MYNHKRLEISYFVYYLLSLSQKDHVNNQTVRSDGAVTQDWTLDKDASLGQFQNNRQGTYLSMLSEHCVLNDTQYCLVKYDSFTE